MPRVRLVLYAVLLASLTVGSLTPGARAEDEAPASPSIADFDAKTRKDLVEAAREYFDPTITSVYYPRKHFVQALDALKAEQGIDALKDLGFLRDLVVQGRGFEPDFSDKGWRRANSVTEFKKESGVYYNLKSERMRFTYVTPKDYPSERNLKKILRDEPFPLIFSFHEEQDLVDRKGNAEAFPGKAVLERRFPKKDYSALYDKWLMLAPVVARAKWLEAHGAIRHGYSTQVLNRFWKHFHVDFDRIVLDGREEAAALAAVFPHVFAGVVLRGGELNPALVSNYASVPVFVYGDAKLEQALKDAGHPDVSSGDDAALASWLESRKRKVPASFDWEILLPDHVFANWILVGGADFAPEGAGEEGESPANPSLSVKSMDTAEDPNTIKIDGRGIEQVTLWLNDSIVDLDREVRLVLNGEVVELGKLERSFKRLFDDDPKIRENMFFGWLYPAFAGPFRLPEPVQKPVEEAPPEEEVVTGSPADEAKAKALWDKAVAAEAEGNAAQAKALFKMIADMEPTSYKAKAEAKLAELGTE